MFKCTSRFWQHRQLTNLYTHTKWLFNGTHPWFILDRDAVWKYHRRQLFRLDMGGGSKLHWKCSICSQSTTLEFLYMGAHVVRWYWLTLYLTTFVGGFNGGSGGGELQREREKEKFRHIYHCVYDGMLIIPTLSKSVYHFNGLQSDKCFANANVPRGKNSLSIENWWKFRFDLFDFVQLESGANSNSKCESTVIVCQIVVICIFGEHLKCLDFSWKTQTQIQSQSQRTRRMCAHQKIIKFIT